MARPARNALVPVMVIVAALFGSACNDRSSPDSREDASSLPEQRTPEVDTDPTPDTSTGGETQTTSPDGTINSAPGG